MRCGRSNAWGGGTKKERKNITKKHDKKRGNLEMALRGCLDGKVGYGDGDRVEQTSAPVRDVALRRAHRTGCCFEERAQDVWGAQRSA